MTGRLSAVAMVLLEKAALDCGFDLERPRAGEWLHYASTHATLEVWLRSDEVGRLIAAVSRPDVAGELREFGEAGSTQLPSGAVNAWVVADVPALHRLLRRAFQLARSLPDALLRVFQAAAAGLPRGTDAERLVVQRVGQDVFRGGLLEYWDGKCAVTGLGVPDLLRASHIKPWAECGTDAERLDVFNGLLLAAHLDAAFDSGLITVSEEGVVVVSDLLDAEARGLLGFDRVLRVKRIEAEHRPYIAYHRERLFRRPPKPSMMTISSAR